MSNPLEDLKNLERELARKQSAYDRDVGALDSAKKTLQDLYGESFKMGSVEKDIQKTEKEIKELEKDFQERVEALTQQLEEYSNEE